MLSMERWTLNDDDDDDDDEGEPFSNGHFQVVELTKLIL